MMKFFVRKFIRYILSIYIIITLNFLIPRMMPGDNPLVYIFGQDIPYDEELLRELKSKYGLDKPIHEQYFIYLINLIHGDLGYSFLYMRPVLDVISEKIVWSLIIIVPSIIFGAIIATIIGLVAGWKSGSRLDMGFTTLNIFLYSIPSFWLAMIIVFIFSFCLGIFPLGGGWSGEAEGLEKYIDILWHATLPILTLTIVNASSYYLIVRNSVIEVLREEFILTAKAKGLDTKKILFRHVLRVASLPLITIIALDFGFIVSGALLIEIVFSWDGMGLLIYEAVKVRDYPLLQGCFLILAICVLTANFIADILYGIVDPRVRSND